jgi:hypothetical protein
MENSRKKAVLFEKRTKNFYWFGSEGVEAEGSRMINVFARLFMDIEKHAPGLSRQVDITMPDFGFCFTAALWPARRNLDKPAR